MKRPLRISHLLMACVLATLSPASMAADPDDGPTLKQFQDVDPPYSHHPLTTPFTFTCHTPLDEIFVAFATSCDMHGVPGVDAGLVSHHLASCDRESERDGYKLCGRWYSQSRIEPLLLVQPMTEGALNFVDDPLRLYDGIQDRTPIKDGQTKMDRWYKTEVAGFCRSKTTGRDRIIVRQHPGAMTIDWYFYSVEASTDRKWEYRFLKFLQNQDPYELTEQFMRCDAKNPRSAPFYLAQISPCECVE